MTIDTKPATSEQESARGDEKASAADPLAGLDRLLGLSEHDQSVHARALRIAGSMATRNTLDCGPGIIPVSDPRAWRKDHLDSMLGSAAAQGSMEGVEALLHLGADPKSSDSHALWAAANNGHAACVELLAPLSEPKDANSRAAWSAAQEGRVDCLALLLPLSDPTHGYAREAFEGTARKGHADCLALLLPYFDARANNSRALIEAANNGHEECVRLLIPHSDPLADGSLALHKAAGLGRLACVAMLLPFSDALSVNPGNNKTPAEGARARGFPLAAEMIEDFIAFEECRKIATEMNAISDGARPGAPSRKERPRI